MAALLIVIVALFLLVTALVIFVPMLVDQIGRFAGELPALVQSFSIRLNEWAPAWMKDAVSKSGADIQGSITQFAGNAADWILSVLEEVRASRGLEAVAHPSILAKRRWSCERHPDANPFWSSPLAFDPFHERVFNRGLFPLGTSIPCACR